MVRAGPGMRPGLYMIYQRRDCVVVDECRIGRIFKRIYKGTERSYIVQFGADGPFEEFKDGRLRIASKLEEDHLDGVR